jgi:Lar family restriction alleviation protein
MTPATDKLKSCPFCGSDTADFSPGSPPWGVVCRDCLAEGPLENTHQEAAMAWNTRNGDHDDR